MNLEDAKRKIKEELYKLRHESREGIIRIAFEIEPCDPLLWLRSQDFQKCIYWKSRDSDFICAGIEEAIFIREKKSFKYRDIFSKIRKFLSTVYPEIRFYGGMRFPIKNIDSEWRDFGSLYFFVPLFELINKGLKSYFVCNIKTPIKDVEAILKKLDSIKTCLDSRKPLTSINYTGREDIPDKEQWKKKLKEAIEQIRKNEIIKVVLARRSSFKLKKPFDPFLLLADPKYKGERAYHFLIKPSSHAMFLSMSPERIFLRKADNLEAEAVAGTRKRGVTEQEDEVLSLELKKSRKELTEHRLVSELLRKKLASICTTFQVKEKETILKLSYMQHLYTSFSGKLKRGVSDSDIISLLYPNPAIAGYPVEYALRKIEEMEEFDRGWYSGPFGWVAQDCAEFVVSIRSGLFVKDTLYLYSGAGIVSESDPEMEWEELNYKIQNFTSFLSYDSSSC